MGKRLFVAAAAAGKTQFAVDLAREMASSLLKEVRVCVPSSMQARAWRERLAGMGGAIGIHVLTFDELVTICLLEVGETYTELSDALQNRLIRSLFDHLTLSHYAALIDKAGFVQVNKRIIGELKAGSIDPQPFASAVNRIGNEPRLAELAVIYGEYQKEIISRNWADRAGLQWLATEALDESAADDCCVWPLLIVDGFDDLAPSQLALLQLLAARVEEFVITLTVAEHVPFPRYQHLKEVVEKALEVEAEPLPEVTQPAQQPALQHLARHIFALPGGESIANDGAVVMRETADRAAEVRTALRWLKQRIVWDGVSPGDVALLARDMTPYRPYVTEIATEFGLPIRLVDGQPLQQNPAITALLELLRLYLPRTGDNHTTLPRRGVIAAWRSPYFAWGDGDITISAGDADALDILSRQHMVMGGLDQWEAAFTAGLAAANHMDKAEEEETSEVLPKSTVVQLRDKFGQFREISEPGDKKRTMRQFSNWLKILLGPDPDGGDPPSAPSTSLRIMVQAGENRRTAVADLSALRRLLDILDDLVWAEEAVGAARPLRFPTFFTELAAAIAAASFTMPSRDGQSEIVVSNTAKVRGVSFRAVALMGLSEGSFPQPVSEDPFLRDIDRYLLREQFDLPLQPSAQSAEQVFFYEAISRAREKLLLTRPVLADNGAEWVASPFWEATRRLIDCQVESIAGERVLPLVETASLAEWWESLADVSGSKMWADGQKENSKAQIERAAQIWLKRQIGEASEREGDLAPVSEDLLESYGANQTWSASRLEAYQTCGFLFFVQNVLQLRARPEPAEGLDAGQLGRLYHDIFEQVMNTGQGQMQDETAVRALVKSVAIPILDAAPRDQGFRVTPWWVQTRAEIIENVIRSLVDLADGEYDFLRAEVAFGFDGSPLILREGQDELKVHGFIDRVDLRKDGRLRIIDYKLGGKSSYSKRAFSTGRKLQLPLYALAAQEALEFGQVAEGFYWHYLQAEASYFQLGKADGGVQGAIETAVSYAWEAVHGIRAGRFVPIPPEEGCPNYCPAISFCGQYSPRSW